MIASGFNGFTSKLCMFFYYYFQVLPHLIDEDIVIFLMKCKNYLKQNGVIIVKENVREQNFYVFREENTLVRTEKMFKEIFKNSGLNLVECFLQQGFPEVKKSKLFE